MAEVGGHDGHETKGMIVCELMQADPMGIPPRKILRHHGDSGRTAPLSEMSAYSESTYARAYPNELRAGLVLPLWILTRLIVELVKRGDQDVRTMHQ